METAAFPRRIEAMPGIAEDHSWQEKVRHWSPRVIELVTLLKQLMGTVQFQLQVQEPFFSQLQDGSKTVEGRCAAGGYDRFVPGDLILFNKILLQEVKAINWYSSFEEMLKTEGLNATLPGVNSVTEGVAIYRRFYSEAKERSGGVLAIHVQCVPEERQPLKIVESILELSSSKLTVGGRALAKHVHRSASGWWGPFSGNDASKNEQALNAITYLIQHACWMNAHYLSPDSPVFEIRVKEGYGARWSSDGTQAECEVITDWWLECQQALIW